MSAGLIAPTDAMADALTDVVLERCRQAEKWGEQNHPDGTHHSPIHADMVRRDCERAFRDGRGTWRHILSEEVAEAYAETDPAKLRAELVQVAAVAVAWVEAIDRRVVTSCTCGSPEAYSLTPAEVVVHHADGPCTIEPRADT